MIETYSKRQASRRSDLFNDELIQDVRISPAHDEFLLLGDVDCRKLGYSTNVAKQDRTNSSL